LTVIGVCAVAMDAKKLTSVMQRAVVTVVRTIVVGCWFWTIWTNRGPRISIDKEKS